MAPQQDPNDVAFILTSAFLIFTMQSGVHSYNRLSDIIQEINDHFDLNTNKIVASVTDNGSNFVKAFKMFGVKLTNINIVDEVMPDSQPTEAFSESDFEDDESSNLEDPEHLLPAHLRCCAHTLSLCATTDANKLLSEQDTPLSQMHAAIMKKCNALWKAAGRSKSAEIMQNVLGHTLSRPGDSRSQALEKGLQENPSKSEDNSSKSEENLSRSEDNSSKSEEIPSKSKKSRISKLTPQITSKQNQLLPSESSQPSTPEQPLASQSSEPLSSKKETSIIPKIKPPPYYRRKRQLPAERTSWDEPIESDIKSNWNKFQTQLSCLKEIKVPRYLNSSSSEIEELQLHGFCDASLNAYSAVFYLKT
ncbi:hypothetical protein LAZ67_23000763 [Cordylochernes scorpioides]|uniref:HAT C-terminal dimerisation domain-containing protein n=1 Tax=Cordylochernes scorpioides TaxID=51811 RepID=A0ABY6LQJ6_9ARAC|nr:hypothetical protein LAZ67_23000763 [Cordylochernes scorpioides]